MNLDSFSVATQGVGIDPMLMAVQGFYEHGQQQQNPLLDDWLYGGGDGYKAPRKPAVVQEPRKSATVALLPAYGMLTAAPPYVVALERYTGLVQLSPAKNRMNTYDPVASALDWRDNDDGIIAAITSFFE